MIMKSRLAILSGSIVLFFFLLGFFFIWMGFFESRTVTLLPDGSSLFEESETGLPGVETVGGIAGDEVVSADVPLVFKNPFTKESDIENQLPLPNPPSVIKAIYATSWSAGSTKKWTRSLILLMRQS
jgi:hypothetical protein